VFYRYIKLLQEMFKIKANDSYLVVDATQSWELLVTEGHVRAARLRLVAPYITAM
jgi:hypothetical protein